MDHRRLKIVVGSYGDVTAWRIPVEEVARLRRLLPDADLRHARSDEELRAGLRDAEVLFGWRLTADDLAHAPALRWVQTPAVGLGALLSPALRASAVVLTNSRGVNAAPIAEHVVATVFACARNLPRAFTRQREHVWAQDELWESASPLVRERTVGVVGLGAIGGEVARLFAALGCRVLGLRRRPELPSPPGVSACRGPDALPWLLAESDVLVLAAPATSRTRGLIGADELARLRPHALLVNVARGDLVDERALEAWLTGSASRGAALDVFAEEPLPAASPLWDLPNALVTPHTSATRGDYWRVVTEMFAANCRRYLAGAALENVVDKDEGY